MHKENDVYVDCGYHHFTILTSFLGVLQKSFSYFLIRGVLINTDFSKVFVALLAGLFIDLI
jgi:hypothetical protein